MLINILVFMIVLLVYLHIFYHLKVSNDLEIYEHDITNKNNLEEILNLRQPVVMNYNRQNLDTIFTIDNIYKNYSNYEMNVRKNNMDNDLVDKNTIVTIDLLKNLFENDNKYYSENNSKFINKSNLTQELEYNDVILKPEDFSISQLVLDTNYNPTMTYEETVGELYEYLICTNNP